MTLHSSIVTSPRHSVLNVMARMNRSIERLRGAASLSLVCEIRILRKMLRAFNDRSQRSCRTIIEMADQECRQSICWAASKRASLMATECRLDTAFGICRGRKEDMWYLVPSSALTMGRPLTVHSLLFVLFAVELLEERAGFDSSSDDASYQTRLLTPAIIYPTNGPQT